MAGLLKNSEMRLSMSSERNRRIEAIAIGPDDDMEARRVDILEAVKRVDSGQGVIILTDMFGGTPSNFAISVMDESKAEVIAGISLPILVKLASIRTEVPLAEAVIMARDAGKKYIKVASQELSGGEGLAQSCLN